MGETDTNDAVPNDDAYTAIEREIVYRLVGRTMMPDRWNMVRDIYARNSPQVVFKTYPGFGHGTNGDIHREVVEFFRHSTPAAN